MARIWHHQLTLALLAVIALAVGYGAIVVSQDFSYREQVLQQEIETAVGAHKSVAQAFFQPYLAVLEALNETDCLQSDEKDACSPLFTRLNTRFPHVANFFAYTADGDVLASGRAYASNVSAKTKQTQFFRSLVVNGDVIHVMNPHVGPFSKTRVTGIAVGLPPKHGDTPAGLIGVSLNFEELRQRWISIALPSHVGAAVLDRSGAVIYAFGLSAEVLEDLPAGLPNSPIRDGNDLIRLAGKSYFIHQEIMPDSLWRVAALHPGPYGLAAYLSDTPLLLLLMPATLMVAILGIALSYREFKNLTALEQAVAGRTAELQQANQSLARRNEEIESFAWVASHDLREPLRNISAYVSLLERRFSDVLNDEGRSYIAIARDGAARINELVLGLLDFIGLDRSGEKPIRCSPAAAANRAMLRRKAVLDDVQAEVIVESLPPFVFISPSHLDLLYNHLIDNAVKHRRADTAPIIICRAELSAGEIVFSVEDNGKGVEEPYRRRVFDLFQRLDPVGVPTGIGIGLTLCRKIVERCDGRIWIESGRAQGTKICFTLPAATVAAEDG